MAHRVAIVRFGNRIMKILNSIRKPSLPLSNLYVVYPFLTGAQLYFCNYFQFHNIKIKVFDILSQSSCHLVLTVVDRVPQPARACALTCCSLATSGLATASSLTYRLP